MKPMIIITKYPVVRLICSSLHKQPVSMLSIGTVVGQVYADAIWFNCPEQKGSG